MFNIVIELEILLGKFSFEGFRLYMFIFFIIYICLYVCII